MRLRILISLELIEVSEATTDDLGVGAELVAAAAHDTLDGLLVSNVLSGGGKVGNDGRRDGGGSASSAGAGA